MAAKLLILEDDEMLRKQLDRLFCRRGYEVRGTGSVRAFVDAAATESFDACLFDLSLPDGDGLDAWAHARAHQAGATAVLMTAYGTDAVVARASDLGVHTLLAKPLDLPALLAAVGGHGAAAAGRVAAAS